ncbi:unnamed protein product, partial [Durusdinium trenchii]
MAEHPGWYVVLIANNSKDLVNAEHDAKLVAEAVLRCQLCTSEDRIKRLFGQTASEVKEFLEDLVDQLAKNDQVFLWYSGHGYEHEGQTLVVGATEQHEDDDSQEITDYLWLEDVLFHLVEQSQKGLTLCCVVASCRTKGIPQQSLTHGVQIIPATNRRPSEENCYAFVYACAAGKTMLDTSIFAMAFCYNLECQPKNLAGLAASLKEECKYVTFGNLLSPALEPFGRTDEIFLHTLQTATPRRFRQNAVWINAIQRARFVSDHLQVLASEEIFRVEDSEPYKSYVAVRDLAGQIIERFYHEAARFQEFRAQLRILACNRLDEVHGVLSVAASASQGYPPNDWEPEEDHQGSEDARVIRNLPDEVVTVIGNVIRKWKDDLPTQPVFDMLQMLGSYFTERNFQDFEGSFRDERVDEYLHYYFRIPRVSGATQEDAEKLHECLEEKCDHLGISEEAMREIRVHLGTGSCYLILVSPVKLKADGLKRCLEDFVKERRCSSFAWAFAQSVEAVPAYAGFQKLVHLVEDLRSEMQIPNVVLFKGSFFRSLAMEILKKNGEVLEEWQLRVVNDHRDLQEDDWCNAHQKLSLHFVTSLHWPSLEWTDAELLDQLKSLANGRSKSQVLHAAAFLIHAMQKDPKDSRARGAKEVLEQFLKEEGELRPEELLHRLLMKVLEDFPWGVAEQIAEAKESEALCYTYTALFRYVVLIVNGADDLTNVLDGARLVGEACVHCGLCTRDQVVEIFDETETVIKEELEKLLAKLKEKDKVFVWYSGHGYGCQDGQHKGYTLLIPKAEQFGSYLSDDEGEDLGDTVNGLWLEDTLFNLLKHRTKLTVWCVVAACREAKPDRDVWHEKKSGRRIVAPNIHEPWPSTGLNRYIFMYACAVGQAMLDTCIFAKAFCFNLASGPPSLMDLQDSLLTDSELVTFGDLHAPPVVTVGQTRGLRLQTQKFVTRDDLEYDPAWIHPMREARLVSMHLHALANDEILKSDNSDPYMPFAHHRAIAAEIIKRFHDQATKYQRFKAQLRITACNDLDQVKAMLSQTSSESLGYAQTEWEPPDENDGTLDMRVLHNLPDDVVGALGGAIRKWKEEVEEGKGLPSRPIFEMLRMLGTYYTERRFPDARLERMGEEDEEDEVKKCLKDYFYIHYIPG